MHAHVLFEGNFALLLHRAAILSTEYDKRLTFSVKQLNFKNVSGKTILKLGLFWRQITRL